MQRVITLKLYCYVHDATEHKIVCHWLFPSQSICATGSTSLPTQLCCKTVCFFVQGQDLLSSKKRVFVSCILSISYLISKTLLFQKLGNSHCVSCISKDNHPYSTLQTKRSFQNKRKYWKILMLCETTPWVLTMLHIDPIAGKNLVSDILLRPQSTSFDVWFTSKPRLVNKWKVFIGMFCLARTEQVIHFHAEKWCRNSKLAAQKYFDINS